MRGKGGRGGAAVEPRKFKANKHELELCKLAGEVTHKLYKPSHKHIHMHMINMGDTLTGIM